MGYYTKQLEMLKIWTKSKEDVKWDEIWDGDGEVERTMDSIPKVIEEADSETLVEDRK